MTAGGLLFIPGTAKERKITGRVVVAGETAGEDLLPGTRVMIAKYGAIDFTVEVEGEPHELMVVSDSNICLIVEDDDIELGDDAL